MVMQIYADVIGQEIEIARSSQTCALGSAIFGAVVVGWSRRWLRHHGRGSGGHARRP